MKQVFISQIFIIFSLFAFHIKLKAQIKITKIDIQSPTCKDSLSGSISFEIEGATAPISYKWSNASTAAPPLKKIKKGLYQVTITDSKSSIVQSFEVLAPKPLEVYYSHTCAFSRHPIVKTNIQMLYFDSIINAKYPIRVYEEINNKIDTISYGILDKNVDYIKYGLGKRLDYNNNLLLIDEKGCEAKIVKIKDKIPGLKYSKAFPDNILNMNIEKINKNDTIYLEKNQPITKEIMAQVSIYPSTDTISQFQWFRNNIPINCTNCLKIKPQACENAIYKLQVADNYRCVLQDSVFIICKEPKDSIIPLNPNTIAYFPTAFSPNDDGINDNFTVFSDEKVEQIKEFIIFDRWGGEIFKTSNIPVSDESKGWNGKAPDNELMPQGNYTYFCRLRLKDGTEKSIKGEVMLMR